MKDEQSLEAGKEIVLSGRKQRDVALDMLKGLCILSCIERCIVSGTGAWHK